MSSMFPPKKNTAFTLFFTLYKNDGTVVANPGSYTKKVSIDGGAMADITASVTEEDPTYGQLSVVLSADEMNGDAIWVYITDDTTGTVPFTCTLYTATTVDANIMAVNSVATHVDKLAAHLPSVLILVVDAASDTTHVVFKTVNGTTPSADDDFYNGAVIVFTSGALAGQRTSISDYVGSTKTATVVAITGAPAEDVTAVIV